MIAEVTSPLHEKQHNYVTFITLLFDWVHTFDLDWWRFVTMTPKFGPLWHIAFVWIVTCILRDVYVRVPIVRLLRLLVLGRTVICLLLILWLLVNDTLYVLFWCL